MFLFKLDRKKSLTVVGLSSGTSADGVDAALVEIKLQPRFSVRLLSFTVYRYSPRLRDKLLELANANEFPIDEIARLNYVLGEVFAQSALKLIKNSRTKVDLIGSHGQTIRHLPQMADYLGKKVRATWQTGEADVIAKRTGITTISDFRSGDVAAGGEGAPLTPYVNYLLFGNRKNTAVLNIGGIANLSFWPKGGSADIIRGFDCGPGNMLVDGIVKSFYGKEFDQGGTLARQGRVNVKLLSLLGKHGFFTDRNRRSTGREEFGRELVSQIVSTAKKLGVDKKDIVTTVAELTVRSIYDSYLRWKAPRFEVETLYLSGGGFYNRYFSKRIEELFRPAEVKNPENVGYPAKALEAISFAVLAHLCVIGKEANLPKVTGAKSKAILGKMSLP